MENITKHQNPSGISLLVPSVQELAKQNLSTVPPRYIIEPQNEDNLVISEANHDLQIPVIDMQRLLSDSIDSAGSSELAKLHHACKEWGFFQLVNHGVSSRLIEKVKMGIQDFFKLPMSEKRKFWQSPEHMEGFGQAFVQSEDQKLDWADMFYFVTLPTYMRMPHLFPHLPLPFRDNLEQYSQEMKKLAMIIIEQMGKALKMEEMEMREIFKDGIQMMRMNYYPPCPEPHKVIGLTAHSDPPALTILSQVNDVQGHQIRKDATWVPVIPFPNAFIINVGDVLEITTNGICRSIEHRAIVNNEKERLSIATFYSPGEDSMVGPAPSLTTGPTPARFKTVGVKDYFKSVFARKLEGKSYLDLMRTDHQH